MQEENLCEYAVIRSRTVQRPSEEVLKFKEMSNNSNN